MRAQQDALVSALVSTLCAYVQYLLRNEDGHTVSRNHKFINS